MDEIISTLTESPVLVAIAFVLLALLLLTIVLRLVKLAVFCGLVIVLYVGWLHFTGQEIPREVKQAEETVRESVKEAGEVLKEKVEQLREFMRDRP